MAATFAILTPTGSPGAIALIEIFADSGPDLDAVLQSLSLYPLHVGACALRTLLGVDHGIVVRWNDQTCHIMPHGGRGIVTVIAERLIALGLLPSSPATYPEAASDIESRMMGALAVAASPLAIDLLLDQPRRWAAGVSSDPRVDRVLNRLMTPPLVVALGSPNVGKSTLANTLSGRSVAIVADQPGTTRDHVGITLDLAGLTVRYLDTPGIRQASDSLEQEAVALSMMAARQADLIILSGDAKSPPPAISLPCPSLRLALRSDLGSAAWPHDLAVSAATGQGMQQLVESICELLVPRAALDSPLPWRFWKNPADPTEKSAGLV